MTAAITPHEPDEELLASADEVFQEADASEKYWREWEERKRLKSIRIEMPELAYRTLMEVAQQQGKTVTQVVQILMDGILSTLLPAAQLSLHESRTKS